jgi:hypothetical protein
MSLAALLLLGITGISAKGSGKNWVSGPDTGANWGKCWGQPYGGGIDFEPNRDTVKWHIKRACWGWEDKGHHRGAYENVSCCRPLSLYRTTQMLIGFGGKDILQAMEPIPVLLQGLRRHGFRQPYQYGDRELEPQCRLYPR